MPNRILKPAPNTPTKTTTTALDSDLLVVMRAFQQLKMSISKLGDSQAEEEVKSKFAVFEQEHMWVSILGADAKAAVDSTLEQLVDSASEGSIDVVLRIFKSLQKIFDPQNAAHVCVEVGYLNDKLAVLIAFSIEQLRALWSHHWDPRTKLTARGRNKLVEAFNRNVVFLKRLFVSRLASMITTDQLVDLLKAMLPFIVINYSSRKNGQEKFSRNVPFELNIIEYFNRTLISAESYLDLTTVAIVMMRLLREFLLAAGRMEADIYQLDLEFRYDFIFVHYGYHYTTGEINGFYERAISHLVKRFFDSMKLKVKFDSLDFNRLLPELHSFLEMGSGIPGIVLVPISNFVETLVAREQDNIWNFAFFASLESSKEKETSCLESLITTKLAELKDPKTAIEQAPNSPTPMDAEQSDRVLKPKKWKRKYKDNGRRSDSSTNNELLADATSPNHEDGQENGDAVLANKPKKPKSSGDKPKGGRRFEGRGRFSPKQQMANVESTKQQSPSVTNVEPANYSIVEQNQSPLQSSEEEPAVPFVVIKVNPITGVPKKSSTHKGKGGKPREPKTSISPSKEEVLVKEPSVADIGPVAEVTV